MKKTLKIFAIIFTILLLTVVCSCESENECSHDWGKGEITTKSTCKEQGVMTYTCQLCGETLTKPIQKSTQHTWVYNGLTKIPTCKEDGETTYTCSVCNETRTEKVASTGAHGYGKPVIGKEATCGEEGEWVQTCSGCGETKITPIKKLKTHGELDGRNFCTICGQDAATYTFFEYKLSPDQKSYYVTAGWVDATTNYTAIVPSTFKGLPVTAIADGAFTSTDVKAVILPNSIISIGFRAFASCDIISITIPDSVTYIDYGTFTRCKYLKSIVIGSGVTKIEYEAFFECESLTSVTFKDPKGWKQGLTGGPYESIDLTDPIENAKNIKAFGSFHVLIKE